jgi:hypothetical protein
MQANDRLPRARKQGLIVERLADDVIVYDLDRHKAHCLNRAAALVWDYCDGRKTVEEVRQALSDELEVATCDEAVWLALEQLGRKHLLEERAARPAGRAVFSRRALARRLGLAAVAVLPLVTSIAAPAALASVSCVPVAGCKGSFTPCSANNECCSCLCAGGSCQ